MEDNAKATVNKTTEVTETSSATTSTERTEKAEPANPLRTPPKPGNPPHKKFTAEVLQRVEGEQAQRLKRTTHLDASNFACTNDMRTKLQFTEAAHYSMYFKHHPTSGYHLTTELKKLYEKFVFFFGGSLKGHTEAQSTEAQYSASQAQLRPYSICASKQSA
eukprot:3746350-Amphidinium_carterae.1